LSLISTSAKLTPCQHSFCDSCIRQFAQASNKCPRCGEKFNGLVSSLGEFASIEACFAEQPSFFHVGPASPSSSSFVDDLLIDENSRIVKYDSDEDWLSDSFLSNNVSRFQGVELDKKVEGDRHFVCNYPDCTSSFKLSGDLKKHLAVHQSDRPFVCEFCEKSFKLKGNYVRHRHLHENQDRKRNFSCKECNRSFFWRGDLNRHMRIHRDREFKCDFRNCLKSFVQKAHLENHRKRIHPLSPSSPSPSSSPTSSATSFPPHPRIGRRTSKDDKQVLATAFKASQTPTDEDLEYLKRELGETWDLVRIRKWFKNKREYLNRRNKQIVVR